MARANNPPENETQMKKTMEPEKIAETSIDEEMSDEEPPFRRSKESSEITPIETNLESEREYHQKKPAPSSMNNPVVQKQNKRKLKARPAQRRKRRKWRSPRKRQFPGKRQIDADTLPNATALM